MKGWRWLEFDYDDGYQVYIICWLYYVYEDYEDDSGSYRIYYHEDETYITYIGFILMMSYMTKNKTMKIAPKKGWGSRHQMVESMSAATVQVISERPTSFRGARRCSLSCRSATTHHHLPCSIHFVTVWRSFWWFGTWLLWLSILGTIIPTDELIFFRGAGQVYHQPVIHFVTMFQT